MSNRAVFVVLLALQLSLVWVYPRFATQDGPSHLYNAAVIAALHSESWSGVSDYFRLNPRPVPNWTTYAILVQLIKEFSPADAEKILVTTYIVLFALSFWRVATIVRADSSHFLIWGLVLGCNWFLSMGFYNFCFGLIFFVLCFGYWFRWRRCFGAKQWLVLSILTSLLYFTHLFCFLMAALLIGITGLLDTLSEAWQHREHGVAFRSLTGALRSVVLPELCFLVFLFLKPFSTVGSQYVAHPATASSIAGILQGLSVYRLTHVFHVLQDCYGPLAKAAVLLIGVFIICAFYWTLRQSREPISAVSYGLAVFSMICFLLYIFGPASFSGTGLLGERAAWFGLWSAFAFLASREWNIRGKLFVRVVATIVCAINLLSGALWRREVSPLLRPYYDAARLVQPNKTILSLCYCAQQYSNPAVLHRLRILPLAHAGDITALAGRDFSIANYEGTGSSFPVEYLSEVNPAIHATGLMENETNPEIADLAEYEEKTGRSIDYVLVWGGPDVHGQSISKSALSEQLQVRYTLIYSAPAPSLLRVFQKSAFR